MIKLIRVKRVDVWEFQKWIKQNIPNLTRYQIEKIEDMDGFTRFSHPYRIYKEIKTKSSPLWRLTLPVYLCVYTLLVLIMPVKFFITGHFTYTKGADWMLTWTNKLFK